ncbi:MAG TPA: cytochrome c [Candidatus Polarisedimenticolia bacterium]|nr:cytochrome c [Candidatus Polarisedimenticolia bacterium]
MRSIVSCAVALTMILAAGVARAQDDKAVKGKAVYTAQKCQMCHAIEGVGNKNRPLDGIGSTLTPEQIKKWIVSPKEVKADTKMKAYPSLPAEDLDALVTFLSGLKKKE